MRASQELFDAYVQEVARYNRWLAKTKIKYRTDDVMAWGDHDYETVNNWNDAMKMTERVLGLTANELEEVNRLSLTLAESNGPNTPWNYWVENPV